MYSSFALTCIVHWPHLFGTCTMKIEKGYYGQGSAAGEAQRARFAVLCEMQNRMLCHLGGITDLPVRFKQNLIPAICI